MANKDASLAVDNTIQHLEQEAETLQEVHKLKPLKSGLRNMSLSLKDFDGQEESHPETAKWFRQVRDTAYEAQNAVDSLVVVCKLQKHKNKFKRLLSGKRSIKQRIQEIEDVAKRIRKIPSSKNYVRTNPVLDDAVGFEEIREALVSQLTREGLQRDIILIHGEKGLGKTTLAKMVYNDATVNHHFPRREWVNVPQDFPLGNSLWRIFIQIMPSSSETECNTNEAALKAKLYESMKGNKYLIVMDNLFESKGHDALISLFPDESNGSRILLTSTLTPEALHVKRSLSHEIGPLDISKSWELLSRKVFGRENYPLVLEDLGKKMVKICNGFPLAIVSLAAILNQTKKTEEMWSKFLEDLAHGVNLARYLDLPAKRELERCLLYFDMSSADFNIRAKKMIQMWAADGLLNRRCSERPEEIGEDYLKKLINSCFIEVVGAERGDGHMKTCRVNTAVWIQNYVNNLYTSESDVQKFLDDKTDNTPIEKDIRLLGIHNDSFMAILKRFENGSRVTSLHCFGKKNKPISSAALWAALYHKFPNVKVLNLESLVLENVPKNLGKLHHLRYLRLRAPSVTHLPTSVSSLSFLETLDMRESRLYSMPPEIWKMEHLRHIYLRGFTMPDASGLYYYKTLWNLQSLSGVHPDKVLKMLMVKAKFPNVTKLRICTKETKVATQFLNSIDHLYHLQSLRVENLTKLPDPNAFPLSLTKLTLLETKLQPPCMKTVEKLPNLRKLKLLKDSISGKEIECDAGGFPQLEVLFLINLVLEKLTRGKGAMRCLKHLFISESVNKEKLPDDLRQMAKEVQTDESCLKATSK